MNEELKVSQRMKILNYIMEHGKITSAECLWNLNIVDGRKRISEMRRAGYSIDDRTVTAINADGKKIRYKEYFLGE